MDEAAAWRERERDECAFHRKEKKKQPAQTPTTQGEERKKLLGLELVLKRGGFGAVGSVLRSKFSYFYGINIIKKVTS